MRSARAILRDRRTWRVALWVLIGLTVGFILSRSMRGKVASDGESQWVTDLLRKIFHSEGISHAFVRKLAHFTEFFILGTELSGILWLERRRSFQSYLNIWFASELCALFDETIQIFSGRGPSVADVWLDTAGATCGILLLFGIRTLCGRARG
ncbi:MAG TPA: VanZ family protein [Clostridiales bacterium]|nr:VanZ family protein [Clostridiales bacterium]